MVPDLIWTSDFFGPLEILSSRNHVLKTFGPLEIWSPNHYVKFSCKAQISPGQHFLGNKKVRGPNEIGGHFSYSLKKYLLDVKSIIANL